MHLAPFAHRARGLEPGLFDHFAGDHRGGGLVGERPASVLFDADRHRLVTRAVEVREDGRGGGERHFVLAGPPAVEHAHTQTFHVFQNTVRRRMSHKP